MCKAEDFKTNVANRLVFEIERKRSWCKSKTNKILSKTVGLPESVICDLSSATDLADLLLLASYLGVDFERIFTPILKDMDIYDD